MGYVGSQNIVNPDANQRLTNEELVARATGPVVRQLQAVFLADRYYETGELPGEASEELLPPGEDSGTSLAQVLPSGPGYHRENTQQIMIALIHAARTRVVLTTPYFMPDASFLLAMRMAAERGVEVDLIVSDRSNKPIVQLAQESNYDDLLDAGVRIHRYYGNFLHAKHATIDADIALIGSSNLDNRSFALNNEVSVLVYDRAVVAELASIQARYLAASHTVDASQWARRSIVRKTLAEHGSADRHVDLSRSGDVWAELIPRDGVTSLQRGLRLSVNTGPCPSSEDGYGNGLGAVARGSSGSLNDPLETFRWKPPAAGLMLGSDLQRT